jgi:xylose isomerase
MACVDSPLQTISDHVPDCCRDIAPLGKDLAETNKFLDLVAEVALELQKGTNIRPLWGTAQLFKDPRYMHGAATSKVHVQALQASCGLLGVDCDRDCAWT